MNDENIKRVNDWFAHLKTGLVNLHLGQFVIMGGIALIIGILLVKS